MKTLLLTALLSFDMPPPNQARFHSDHKGFMGSISFTGTVVQETGMSVTPQGNQLAIVMWETGKPTTYLTKQIDMPEEETMIAMGINSLTITPLKAEEFMIAKVTKQRKKR